MNGRSPGFRAPIPHCEGNAVKQYSNGFPNLTRCFLAGFHHPRATQAALISALPAQPGAREDRRPRPFSAGLARVPAARRTAREAWAAMRSGAVSGGRRDHFEHGEPEPDRAMDGENYRA